MHEGYSFWHSVVFLILFHLAVLVVIELVETGSSRYIKQAALFVRAPML